MLLYSVSRQIFAHFTFKAMSQPGYESKASPCLAFFLPLSLVNYVSLPVSLSLPDKTHAKLKYLLLVFPNTTSYFYRYVYALLNANLLFAYKHEPTYLYFVSYSYELYIIHFNRF